MNDSVNNKILGSNARKAISYLRGIFISEEISHLKADSIACTIEQLLNRINNKNGPVLKIVRNGDTVLRRVECDKCNAIYTASSHYFKPAQMYDKPGMLQIKCPCCNTTNFIIS